MDAMKLQYNIHHIKESFHPCFNQGLQKLLVQKGGVAHALGGGGVGWGERSIPSCNLINYRFSSFTIPLSRPYMTTTIAYLLVSNMTKSSPLAPLQCINS